MSPARTGARPAAMASGSSWCSSTSIPAASISSENTLTSSLVTRSFSVTWLLLVVAMTLRTELWDPTGHGGGVFAVHGNAAAAADGVNEVQPAVFHKFKRLQGDVDVAAVGEMVVDHLEIAVKYKLEAALHAAKFF